MKKLQTTVGVRLALALGGLSVPSFRSLKREEGQTFVEYALILALISVALTGALLTLQGKIQGIFTAISNDL
jgi:Flp pilus assembly pilin Flp